MAASWVAGGTTTVTGGAAAITPPLPAGIQTNDILLLFVHTANQTPAATWPPTGWTQVTGSPWGQGTAAAATATRLAVCWLRVAGGESAPTVQDSGDHQHAVIHAFRGCPTTGDPWDVIVGGTEATSDTTGSATQVTTTAVDELVVVAFDCETDIATARFTAWTNGNLTGLTERSDGATTDGSGGGIGVATGVKATAGATGATTVTYATASLKSFVTIALKTAPADAPRRCPVVAPAVAVVRSASW